MIKEAARTGIALVVLGLAAAAVAIGWAWGNNRKIL